MTRPHDTDDLSDADLQRLVELDRNQSDDGLSNSDTTEIANPDLKRAKRGLDFLNQVRESNPHVVDDLAIEANMPTWFEMDGDHPAKIGRHEIIRRLGAGGFGVVFLARDPELDRLVALKVPRVETLIHPQTRRRFVRESKTAAQFDHPNIATVYEAGAIGPALYIASQYCPGGSIEDYLEKAGGRLPIRVAVEVMASLAEAVDHAHSRGILHRDIKPTNILLDIAPEEVDQLESNPEKLGTVAKLVDFGLAKNIESADDETRSGIMLGTPAYTAPELVLEKTDVGPTADIYSLGATLYHTLTGAPPHQRDTKFETLLAAQKTDAIPPSRHVSEIPRDLDAICLKALERNPEERYQSAAAMASDLRNHLSGKPISARRANNFEKIIKWSRRNSVVASLLFALTLLAALAMGAVLSAYSLYQTQSQFDAQLERQLKSMKIRRTFDIGHRVLGSPTEPVQIPDTPGRIGRVQFEQLDISADGRLVIVAKGGYIHLWDIANAQQLAKLPARGDAAAFLGDGTGIIYASEDNRLMMNRISTVVGVNEVKIALSPPAAIDDGPFNRHELLLSVQPGKDTFAFQSAPGVATILDLETGRRLSRDFDTPISSLSLSANGRLLAAALPDQNSIDVISTLVDQVIAVIKTPVPTYVEFSPDSNLLASSNGKACVIRKRPEWDGDSMPGPSQHISRVSFSADSRLMATATGPDELTMVQAGQTDAVAVIAVREDETVSNMKFSPDGTKFLATTNNGLLYFWDLAWIDERLSPLDFDVQLSAIDSSPQENLPIVFDAPWLDDSGQ